MDEPSKTNPRRRVRSSWLALAALSIAVAVPGPVRAKEAPVSVERSVKSREVVHRAPGNRVQRDGSGRRCPSMV
jgi:hypothetical protein